MRLSHVSCHGFRSLKMVSFDAGTYTTFIGKNDSGKSSMLAAVRFLFDPEFKLLPTDRSKFVEDADECYVSATIINCRHELAVNGTLTVRRTLNPLPSRLEYLGKIPALPILRELSEGAMTKKRLEEDESLSAEQKKAILEELSKFSSGGRATVEEWKLAYKGFVETNEIQLQNGWKRISEEVLGCLIQVIYLRADVRGEEEVNDSGKSTFSKVGGLILREAAKKFPGIQESLSQLEQAVVAASEKSEDGRWKLEELNQLQELLKEEVSRFDTTVNANPMIMAPQVPKVDFGFALHVSDGCVDGLDKMGHGLRRAIVFAMLRTHRRIRENHDAQRGQVDESGPLYLFLIEEPELYLHPQAEKRRMRDLRELAANPSAQVFVCSHSAFFVDLEDYKSIYRFDRPARGETSVRGWEADELPPLDRKTLSLIHRFHPGKAAMLFADLVILCEGQCEAQALPAVAEALDIAIADKDIEIVDCGGNEHVPVYQKVLEGFGVKYVAWIDTDDQDLLTRVSNGCSTAFGRLVTNEVDWELMNELPAGGKLKAFNSWKHFVFDQNPPNDKLAERVRAAFGWTNGP